MHQIELRRRQRIGRDVVSSDFEIRSVQRFEESRVDVGRKHLPVTAYAVAEPCCNAASSGPDLQATPTATDGDVREVTDRSGVEDVGERGKARCCLGSRVLESVGRLRDSLMAGWQVVTRHLGLPRCFDRAHSADAENDVMMLKSQARAGMGNRAARILGPRSRPLDQASTSDARQA